MTSIKSHQTFQESTSTLSTIIFTQTANYGNFLLLFIDSFRQRENTLFGPAARIFNMLLSVASAKTTLLFLYAIFK